MENLNMSYRDAMNDQYFGNFSISSLAFIIPPLCSVYTNSLDHFILQSCIFITTFLRWGWRDNEMYVLIDHTYAKIIFIYYCWCGIKSLRKDNELEILFGLGLLLSTCMYYILGVLAFENEKDVNVVYHMIVHAYSVFGFSLANFIFESHFSFF
jgi:hypothetical protein